MRPLSEPNKSYNKNIGATSFEAYWIGRVMSHVHRYHFKSEQKNSVTWKRVRYGCLLCACMCQLSALAARIHSVRPTISALALGLAITVISRKRKKSFKMIKSERAAATILPIFCVRMWGASFAVHFIIIVFRTMNFVWYLHASRQQGQQWQWMRVQNWWRRALILFIRPTKQFYV